MIEAVIVAAVRTPVGRGKPGGALSEVHPVDLLGGVLRQIVDRNGLDPGRIDDVIVGCVSQAGEQSNTPGRMALLSAGFPAHVPATTIDRKCGSSQQAIQFAVQGIMAGHYEIVIAGGIDSMSRVPLVSARMGADIFGPGVNARFTPGLVSQGVAAELIAQRWGFCRSRLDAYAAASHARAARVQEAGLFDAEIVPVVTPGGVVARDETIRAGTTAEGLSALCTSFESAEMSARFPDIEWSITAGNSSQLADGAAALLIMAEPVARRLGLTPRARFVAFDVVGDDPLFMLTAPIPATRRILRKSGLALDAISHFEVNEAFASVPLAWAAEFDADPERLNRASLRILASSFRTGTSPSAPAASPRSLR